MYKKMICGAMLVVGVFSLHASQVLVPGTGTAGQGPSEPATDSLAYYDNGVSGSTQKIGTAPGNIFPYWAVGFNQGVGQVDSIMAFLNADAGSRAVYFRIFGDNGGVPGPMIWSDSMTYLIPNAPAQWYGSAVNPPVSVSGKFYVAVVPYSGSAGSVWQHWDNNGRQAPSGTQWQYNGTSWVPDPHTPVGDLMIRCYVNLHNVGVTQILAPVGTIDSGSYVTPRAEVTNFGDYTETYKVKMKIGTFYHESTTVYFQSPNSSQQITFPGLSMNVQPGNYTVSCSTCLANDVNRADDRKTGTVTVQRPQLDVGVKAIVAPVGSVNQGATLTPACSVRNYGGVTASYTVRMKIGTTYTGTATVNSQPPGNTRYVTFPNWTANQPGTQVVSCSTELTGDVNAGNDKLTGTVNVLSGDVGVVRILAPSGTVDSGTVCTPACSVYNYGSATVSYAVRMKVGGFYSNAQAVSNHTPGTKVYVPFSPSVVWPRGTYTVSCSTELLGDVNTGNDRITGSVTGRVLDAEALAILAPAGTIDSGTSVAPQVSVRNNGSAAATFNVECRIGSWNNTKTVSLDPGVTDTVVFDNWTALPRGVLDVKCTTRLAGDAVPANNTRTSSIDVAVHDVAVLTIVAPSGTVAPGAVIPRAAVRNRGTLREPCTATFMISSSPPYQQTVSLSAGLPLGVDTLVVFPGWNAVNGNYTARCSVYMATDQVVANNVASVPFRVGQRDTGWARMPDIPSGPRGKAVKDGGCLTGNQEQYLPYVYALKGNSTVEFYCFSVYGNTWQTKESIPAVGSSGKKKAIKKGASITSVDGAIYAVKGNNTLEFWKYTPGRTPYPWQQLADVPAGARNVKEGAGLVGVKRGDTAFVYLLKGSGTFEFCRYSVRTGLWSTLANAPAGTSGKPYKNGSCVAHNPDKRYIYALKGSTNELAFYRLDRNEWGATTALPMVGNSGKKKKAKDGCGIAYDPEHRLLFALKGGNTTEFWAFNPDAENWVQCSDMPVGAGKQVKAGGALAYVSGTGDQLSGLYALKGNNTLEFYSYVPGGTLNSPTAPANCSHNGSLPKSNSRLLVTPNPFSDGAMVSFNLPQSGRSLVRLYDAAGRLMTTVWDGYLASGNHTLGLAKALPAGVYLLCIDGAGLRSTHKLVVE